MCKKERDIFDDRFYCSDDEYYTPLFDCSDEALQADWEDIKDCDYEEDRH